MEIKICLSGATGNVGREIVKELDKQPNRDLLVTAAVGRRHCGRILSDVLPKPAPDAHIFNDVPTAHAASPFDVLVDYTTPDSVFQTIMEAIELGVHCVIGTSGLVDAQYAEISSAAEAKGIGVFAAGNFSITAALMTHFSQLATQFVPSWEIFDYGSDTKIDAPSGTARELAYLLSQKGKPDYRYTPAEIRGIAESRGASLNDSQVHSVRLPGYYSSAEVQFGLAGERLSIRHDSFSHAPYVAGTLLAVRKVAEMTGLVRGMDKLLGLGGER